LVLVVLVVLHPLHLRAMRGLPEDRLRSVRGSLDMVVQTDDLQERTQAEAVVGRLQRPEVLLLEPQVVLEADSVLEQEGSVMGHQRPAPVLMG